MHNLEILYHIFPWYLSFRTKFSLQRILPYLILHGPISPLSGTFGNLWPQSLLWGLGLWGCGLWGCGLWGGVLRPHGARHLKCPPYLLQEIVRGSEAQHAHHAWVSKLSTSGAGVGGGGALMSQCVAQIAGAPSLWGGAAHCTLYGDILLQVVPQARSPSPPPPPPTKSGLWPWLGGGKKSASKPRRRSSGQHRAEQTGTAH